MIEVLNKNNNKIHEISIEDYLKTIAKTPKGQLTRLIDLVNGEIYQDVYTAYRLKGLNNYKWNWNK